MHMRVVRTFLLLLFGIQAAQAEPISFRLTFSEKALDQRFTGRVFVMLSKSKSREPIAGISWFRPEPVFAKDVRGWRPGEPLFLKAGEALAYPTPMSELEPGEYSIQAVMDLDQGSRHFGNGPGNPHSKVLRQEIDPSASGAIKLHLDQVVSEKEFKETERVKLVRLKSKLLSDFHGKPTFIQAGLVLPESFEEEPKRTYPVLYVVPGFGGNHFGAFSHEKRYGTDIGGEEFLVVVLDPDCRWGHSVFADSENNGPWGKALTEELIPHLEARFRGRNEMESRFVTGHSSGGWSSLWLQVAYPDVFGGCWSTAPDPVDFRDFQMVDIYRPKNNIFFDEKGEKRPLGRSGDKPLLFYKPFSDMEVLMGHGGQLGSFEAVFGPRGEDGRPLPLWDRKTGAINPEVAKAWETHDIRLHLERNWKTLGPKLKGKIRVYMGGKDTFYLDGATRLLKKSLADLGSDAVVEIFEERNHGNLVDAKLRKRMHREMVEQLNR